MCKKNWIKIGFPWSQTNTNLSLSITGADSFVEWANTQYTASLVLSWVIGSPSTVLTVTLPTWITYVSSSDSGSESAWVITWTLWSLMANKSVTFTITSDTPATWYDLDGVVTSDFANLWTATATKEVEVEEAGWWIEVRITCALFNSGAAPTEISAFSRWATNLLTSFTEDIVFISWYTYKVWTLSSVWWSWQTWGIGFVFSSTTYSCLITATTPSVLDWGWVPLNIVAWCADDESPSYNPAVNAFTADLCF